MDYKEKYKQALAKAKEQYNYPCMQSCMGILEEIFPELKESEDEWIRKELIKETKGSEVRLFETVTNDEFVAWLENIPATIDHEKREGFHLGYRACHEKQGEQKPNPYSGTSFEYNGHTWGMCARDNGVEILIDGHIKGRVFTNDSNAKEIFIKALERVEELNSKGYKLTDCDKNSWWEDFKAYTSCTIEQKHSWSEEDEENMKKILEAIGSYYYLTTDDDVLCNWLKSLKGRVQPRQEWSEEDDITRKALINLVEMFYGGCIDKSEKNRLLSWLKSLRPQNRWKPSERHLACLQDAIEHYHLMGSPATTLTEILKQLRKLKEGKV